MTEPTARIVLDSTYGGVRLTTFEVVVPTFTWTHILTHRAFSRNAQSHRAIPVLKLIEKATYTPKVWGAKGKGMSPSSALDEERAALAERMWLEDRAHAIERAREYDRLGVHKELANRVLTPYILMTGLISATEWDNFFELRCGTEGGTQEDTSEIALLMRRLMQESTPVTRQQHRPFVTDTEYDDHEHADLISAARCARVSYTSHDGEIDLEKDLMLATRLWEERHLSPFEHVARVGVAPRTNFRPPWVQYRTRVGRAA